MNENVARSVNSKGHLSSRLVADRISRHKFAVFVFFQAKYKYPAQHSPAKILQIEQN